MDLATYDFLLLELNRNYPEISINHLEIFLLNIALILGEARLGFISELDGRYPPYLYHRILNYILSFFPDELDVRSSTGTFLIGGEYEGERVADRRTSILICSKFKNALITSIFEEFDEDLAIGIILGFPCAEKEWGNIILQDFYFVSIMAIPENPERGFFLFGFSCRSPLSIETENQIQDLVNRCQVALTGYGIYVSAALTLAPGQTIVKMSPKSEMRKDVSLSDWYF